MTPPFYRGGAVPHYVSEPFSRPPIAAPYDAAARRSTN